jgi:membrane protease YdiL (CAAX protease family)
MPNQKKKYRLIAFLLAIAALVLQCLSLTRFKGDASMLVYLFSEWFLVLGSLLLAMALLNDGLRAIGMDPRHGLRLYLPGAAIGAGMFLLFVIVALLLGGYSIGINPAGVDWPMIILFMIAFVGQSAFEEIFSRGFLLYWLKTKIGAIGAVLVTATIFSLMHIPNGHTTVLSVLNLFLVGVFYGLMVLRTGSLWMACGAHFAWNFLETNVFLVPNSGNAVTTGIFKLTPLAENELLIGKEFGPEGSLTVSIIHLLAILLLALSFMKAKSNPAAASQAAPSEEAA